MALLLQKIVEKKMSKSVSGKKDEKKTVHTATKPSCGMGGGKVLAASKKNTNLDLYFLFCTLIPHPILITLHAEHKILRKCIFLESKTQIEEKD